MPGSPPIKRCTRGLQNVSYLAYLVPLDATLRHLHSRFARPTRSSTTRLGRASPQAHKACSALHTCLAPESTVPASLIARGPLHRASGAWPRQNNCYPARSSCALERGGCSTCKQPSVPGRVTKVGREAPDPKGLALPGNVLSKSKLLHRCTMGGAFL